MKHFLGGFFWMVSAVMLMGANITVTSPNGGENWQQGQSRQITWTSTGITSGTFQVTLWKGGISQGVVASGLPCTQHAFNWTVGQLENAPVAVPGPGYTIKVRLQNQTPSDFSNAAFTISAPLPAGAVTVTCLNQNVKYQMENGSPFNITWTTSGIGAGNFDVTLWRQGILRGVIAKGLPHTQKEFNWTVGALEGGQYAPALSGYTIQVCLQGQGVKDSNDTAFAILPTTSEHLVKRASLGAPKGTVLQQAASAQRPDLWIERIEIGQVVSSRSRGNQSNTRSDVIRPGDTIFFSVYVGSKGGEAETWYATIAGMYYLGVEPSRAHCLEPWTHQDGYVTDTMRVGSSPFYWIRMTLPSAWSGKESFRYYYCCFKIDSENEYAESNEGNNCKCLKIAVFK